ncbi:MAG TPA: TIGR03943 family protein [Pseudonocardiaceae bacterium]
MRRETQNVLLVLLGGALLKISLNGSYTRYVKPELLPWLVGAGSVMVLLAAVAIGRDLVVAHRVRAVARVGGGAPADPAGSCDHPHREPYSPWLLLLVVLAILLVQPPALGADAVNRAAARNPGEPRAVTAFDELPGGEVIELPISEVLLRSVWDDRGTLDGRVLRLTGFVVRAEDGTTYLARMAIRCCAADASPVRVRLDGPTQRIAAFPPDTWLEVTGTVRKGTAGPDNGFVPTFDVTDLRPVPEPATPYE